MYLVGFEAALLESVRECNPLFYDGVLPATDPSYAIWNSLRDGFGESLHPLWIGVFMPILPEG
jgi:hypothetical protein